MRIFRGGGGAEVLAVGLLPLDVMSVHVCLPAGTEADYVQWLAHSAESTGSSDGCVLGYKETFLRLRKGSFCFNGRDYAVTKKLSPCPCTLDDYHWYDVIVMAS